MRYLINKTEVRRNDKAAGLAPGTTCIRCGGLLLGRCYAVRTWRTPIMKGSAFWPMHTSCAGVAEPREGATDG